MNVIRKTAFVSKATLRCLSTTSHKASWLFSSDAAKTSGHSKLLTDKETVYQIVSDTVAPRDWEDYVKHKGQLMQRANDTEGIRWEHCASWHFRYGDVVFRAMHLIKFDGGWSDVDTTRHALKTDQKYQKEYHAGLKLITQQSNEFLKSFSHWPEPEKRTGDNIYDVRTYYVKPGSMYDWGNYWSRGIKCRTRVRPDIPYAASSPSWASCTPFTTYGSIPISRTARSAARTRGTRPTGTRSWPTPSPSSGPCPPASSSRSPSRPRSELLPISLSHLQQRLCQDIM